MARTGLWAPPARKRWLATAALVCLAVTTSLRACGPWLPEQILTIRQVILRTPVGDFSQEVLALTEADGAPALPPGLTRRPVPSRKGDEDYSGEENPSHGPSEAEKAELLDALRHYHVPVDKQDNLAVAYASFRTELNARAALVRQDDNSSAEGFRFDLRARSVHRPAAGSVVLPATLSEGLPGEWADYLQGAFCFWSDDPAGAKTAWEHLLARPPAERLYCSTWAAYMLARIQDDPSAPPDENARRYQRVRQLCAEGCRDLFDLASASFGWEAHLALDHDDHSAAIRLYYLQGISGSEDLDKIGYSLHIVTSDALGKDEADSAAMTKAARDPFLRRIVTLYLACHRIFSDEDDHLIHQPATAETPEPPQTDGHNPAETEKRWLEVLTQAGVDNVREAAPVAWSAYRAADFAQAAAWLTKAPAADGLALWLRAKLALRDGKTDAAAACFARAVRSYPFEIKPVDNPIDTADQRVSDGQTFRTQQFHADLGIISLARSDYTQALSALLRSGYWRDAAYVAERVLTPDELLAYVRTNFPNQPPAVEPPGKNPDATDAYSSESTSVQQLQNRLAVDYTSNPAVYSLRYLLARRLSRLGRYADAREFYPTVLLPKFDELLAALKLGDATRETKDKRADALWRAAKIERWLGMEIFGTEDDPDWFVDAGVYDYGDHYREARLQTPWENSDSGPQPTPAPPFVPPVGRDEKRRVAKDEVHPPVRFHYRPPAAELAWKAATLMPDQQERTAQVLAAGGLWLARMDDEKGVDKFYQAILRRCGQTAIGQKAKSSGGIPDVPHEDP